MDLATFTSLLTPAGQAALAEAVTVRPTEATFLTCFTRLAKRHPADLARAALETALLRIRARAKFQRADVTYFTREALEQATGETVSRYRAARFARFPVVGDFCCGVGGDTLALAAGRSVVAVDRDPLRLAMAEQNLAAYGLHDRVTFLCGDLLTLALPDVPAVFLDPDRRPGGRRRVAVREYEPALDALRARLPAGVALGVKVAPAASWEELAGYDVEAEFISVGGELKECVLWFGPLRTAARRATVLPGPHTLSAEAPAAPAEPGPPLAYLYDPDPAVVRAGLVTDLAVRLGARPLDAAIAYLTADVLTATPLARAYRIEEALPFQVKRLRLRLRALRVGRVTVLKRGSAVEPGELVRQLKLTGSEGRVVVLTRVQGRPFALVGRACPGPGE
jgi:SAM-dependent methyltransferase